MLYADYNDYVDFNNGTMFPRLGVSGTMEKIHRASEFSAELLYRFNPRASA